MAPAMAQPRLFLVDVFAERRYAGNPLAVVVGADDWAGEAMQAFAREMNFSETTFVGGRETNGAWRVRIFTPSEELPFAGHPTLGTAWVLARVLGAGAGGVTLALGIGEVPVAIEEDRYGELAWMTPRSPLAGDEFDGAEVAGLLGLEQADLDPAHPCRLMSVGVEFAFVPLASIEALRRARPAVPPRAANGGPIGIVAFAAEAYEPGGDLSVRVFFDAGGVREDPATGSAAVCMGAYLSDSRYFGVDRVSARIQQGYEIGRPSCIYVEAEPGRDGVRVSVGGKVRLVAAGALA